MQLCTTRCVLFTLPPHPEMEGTNFEIRVAAEIVARFAAASDMELVKTEETDRPHRKKANLLKRAWRKISARQLLLTERGTAEDKDRLSTPPSSPRSDSHSIRLSESVELTVHGIRECTYLHRDRQAPCLHDVRLSVAQSSGCRARMPVLTAQNSYAIYRLLQIFDADIERVMEGHFGKHEADERAGRYREMLTRANPSALCLQILGTHQRRTTGHGSYDDLHALYELGSLEELPSRSQSPASAPGSARDRSRDDGDDAGDDLGRGSLAFPKTLHGSPSWEVLGKTAEGTEGTSIALHEKTNDPVVL